MARLSLPVNQECNGTLPVTGEIAQYLRDQGFEGFDPDTHFVAMPHIMPDVVDWLSAMIELGIKPQNIHLIGKQYSQVDETRDKLIGMGIDVMEYTPTPVGQYYDTLLNVDLPKFWEHAQEKIKSTGNGKPRTVIVMDDGGRLLRSTPPQMISDPNIKIVGVEQTTNGFDVVSEHGHPIDIVIPAMSALKLEFEPPFIADAALRKLRDKLGMFHNRDVAVVGVGKIGGALCETLADNRNSVFVYDPAVKISDGQLSDPQGLIPAGINVYAAPVGNEKKANARLLRASNPPSRSNYYICDSLEHAVQSSNYVFGCTGKDIFRDIDLDKMRFQGPGKAIAETRFISVSSGDKEFQSLLKWITQQPEGFKHHGPDEKLGSRWDVTINHKGSKLRVAQQGFPINFDGKTCSGTPEEMQLISSFLLASIVQGYDYVNKYPVKSQDDQKNLIMLSPTVQRRILMSWLDKVPSIQGLYKPERIEEIRNDPLWFATHSRQGEFVPVFRDDYPIPEVLANRVISAVPMAKEKAHG